MVTFRRSRTRPPFERGRVQRELLVEATRGATPRRPRLGMARHRSPATLAAAPGEGRSQRARRAKSSAPAHAWLQIRASNRKDRKCQPVSFSTTSKPSVRIPARRGSRNSRRSAPTRPQPIEEPISFFVRPADDLLPSPVATLITGITPQHALREGMNEAEAFAAYSRRCRGRKLHARLQLARFDDEFVASACSGTSSMRMSANGAAAMPLGLARSVATRHAIRPDGIAWPSATMARPRSGSSTLPSPTACEKATRTKRCQTSCPDRHRAQVPRRAATALGLRVATARQAAGRASWIRGDGAGPARSQRFPAARLCAAAVLPLTRHPQIDSRVSSSTWTANPTPCWRWTSKNRGPPLHAGRRPFRRAKRGSR